MTATATLTLDYPRELTHPLHTAAMQLVVGVEQRHPQSMLDAYARRLRDLSGAISSTAFCVDGTPITTGDGKWI